MSLNWPIGPWGKELMGHGRGPMDQIFYKTITKHLIKII